MDENNNYDHVADIFAFIKEHGYKVQTFTTATRRNGKGAYDYVELSLVVPHEKPHKPFEQVLKEIEDDLNSSDEQKEEVIKNEV